MDHEQRIQALESELEQLKDAVLYHRVIAKAQINVIMNWVLEVSPSVAGCSRSDQAAGLSRATKMAIEKILLDLEDRDPGAAARILSMDPASGDDPLRFDED